VVYEIQPNDLTDITNTPTLCANGDNVDRHHYKLINSHPFHLQLVFFSYLFSLYNILLFLLIFSFARDVLLNIPLVGSPTSISVSPDGNKIFVVDWGVRYVLSFDGNGTEVARIGGGEFPNPCGLYVDGKGVVYVSSVLDNKVAVVAPDGKVLRVFDAEGTLNHPRGLCVDEATGNIYIAVSPTGNGISLEMESISSGPPEVGSHL
jgi:hypothetical protein